MPHPVKGEEVYLFCVLRSGQAPGPALAEELAQRVAELGRTLRPGRVLFTTELPKTRNAKVMRRSIRVVASGSAELGDTTGLENLQAIEAVRASLRPALRPGSPPRVAHVVRGAQVGRQGRPVVVQDVSRGARPSPGRRCQLRFHRKTWVTKGASALRISIRAT